MDHRVPDPQEVRFIITRLRTQTWEFKRELQRAAMNVALLDRIARQADAEREKPTDSEPH
jgi:hypothetical protein